MRRKGTLFASTLVLQALLSCKQAEPQGDLGLEPDLAASMDLAGAAEDLSLPPDQKGGDLRVPTDLPPPGDLGQDMGSRVCGIPCSCLTSAPAATRTKYVTNALRLPTSMASYAADLDGDGRVDNQYKAILSALGAAGFDLEMALAQEVQRGNQVTLLELQAADLVNGCGRLNVAPATTRKLGDPVPKYDGTDVFTAATPLKTLFGNLSATSLNTVPTRYLEPPEVISLPLPLGFFGVIPVPVHGVHIQASVSASNLMSGEIHGVILKSDIDTILIPGIAGVLTETINKDPLSSATETLVRLFEDPVGNPVSQAKCMVAADCCKLPANRKTCKILPAEVASNAIIGAVLAPDLQMTQGGIWKPLPKGMVKDSLSFGMGFTAVRASF